MRGILRHRDPLLALAFLAFGLAELLSRTRYEGRLTWPGATSVSLLALALITLPLAWRRTRPTAAALVVLGTISAYSALVGAAEATAVFLSLLVVCFSGAAYSRWPWLIAVSALATMGVFNSFDPLVTDWNDWFWSGGFIVVALLLGAAVRNRQVRIVSLEQDAARLAREYDERVAAATTAERAAIARELHDIVAHSVSVIVVQAQAGARALHDDVRTTERLLTSIETTGRSALDDLRRLLRLLSADGQPVDPSPGLAHVCDLVETFRTAGLEVELDLPTDLPHLSAAADLAAYRLVQEGLTNTVRHAPGSSASVAVAARPGEVVITVRDTGSDEPPRDDLGAGRGLIGMRERVGLAGGRLLECGSTGHGFLVRAALPATANSPALV